MSVSGNRTLVRFEGASIEVRPDPDFAAVEVESQIHKAAALWFCSGKIR